MDGIQNVPGRSDIFERAAGSRCGGDASGGEDDERRGDEEEEREDLREGNDSAAGDEGVGGSRGADQEEV